MGEPLKGKGDDVQPENDEIFYNEDDVKSAVEWYKYFKDDANLLVEEFPKYKDKLLKDKVVYEEDGSVWEKDVDEYRDWLLDKAFEDVCVNK